MFTPRTILLVLLFLLSWILYLDRAAISTAKDLVAKDLGLSNDAMGVVFGSFALAYALGQIPAGWFADRFGPRMTLTIVVSAWSLFTALTGLAPEFATLVVVRFLFGLAEAGAFPASARAFYTWLPAELHGRANGIIFSGSRLGAALSFPILAGLLDGSGWRVAFFILGVPGLVWAAVWFAWFRDRPAPPTTTIDPPLRDIFRSRAMLQVMAQYFSSNFTFFLCLTWMLPYLMERYHLTRERASWYSMTILLVGATAQWASGFLTDWLYQRYPRWSRRAPAFAGFVVAASALLILTQANTPEMAVALFTLATFGTEMTISPSWAYCIDIGGGKSGAVSGAMNMVGNLGGFVSASAFPALARWNGGDASLYFLVAALMNVTSAIFWLRMPLKDKLR
ncbi:MAG: MFS transporter [Acidobacteria bacterium]|nr:MFS transporter [Acidobacteriota bacterium]